MARMSSNRREGGEGIGVNSLPKNNHKKVAWPGLETETFSLWANVLPLSYSMRFTGSSTTQNLKNKTLYDKNINVLYPDWFIKLHVNMLCYYFIIMYRYRCKW